MYCTLLHSRFVWIAMSSKTAEKNAPSTRCRPTLQTKHRLWVAQAHTLSGAPCIADCCAIASFRFEVEDIWSWLTEGALLPEMAFALASFPTH